MEWDREIFDSHFHIGKFGTQDSAIGMVDLFKNRELINHKQIKKHLKINNITKGVISPHYTSDLKHPFAEFNPIIVDAVDKFHNLFGVMWVNPLEPSLNADVMDAAVLNQKILGLKMNPNTWGKGVTPDPKTWSPEFKNGMEDILDFAAKNKFVLQMSTGLGNSEIQRYDNFMEKYGHNQRIHFLHMGGSVTGHVKFVPRFIDWIQREFDVYTDTSRALAFGPHFLIKECIEKSDNALKRIMFASDEPWGIFQAELSLLRHLGLDKTLRYRILFYNANMLYCHGD
jgi:predicted TIM-barrel fold metal-dependent hydrolase